MPTRESEEIIGAHTFADNDAGEGPDLWKLRSEREEARKRFLHELSLEMHRLERINNLQFCLELLEMFLSEAERVSVGYDVLNERFPRYIASSSDVARFFYSTKDKIQEFAPASEVERAWLLGAFVRDSVFPAALGFLPSILKEDDEHPERSITFGPAS